MMIVSSSPVPVRAEGADAIAMGADAIAMDRNRNVEEHQEAPASHGEPEEIDQHEGEAHPEPEGGAHPEPGETDQHDGEAHPPEGGAQPEGDAQPRARANGPFHHGPPASPKRKGEEGLGLAWVSKRMGPAQHTIMKYTTKITIERIVDRSRSPHKVTTQTHVVEEAERIA